MWRLYPKTEDSQRNFLLEGIEVQRHCVTTHDKNSFIVQTTDGKEAPTVKLTIRNIPVSYSSDEMERTLEKLGCKPHSKMLMEQDLKWGGGGDHSLADWQKVSLH